MHANRDDEPQVGRQVLEAQISVVDALTYLRESCDHKRQACEDIGCEAPIQRRIANLIAALAAPSAPQAERPEAATPLEALLAEYEEIKANLDEAYDDEATFAIRSYRRELDEFAAKLAALAPKPEPEATLREKVKELVDALVDGDITKVEAVYAFAALAAPSVAPRSVSKEELSALYECVSTLAFTDTSRLFSAQERTRLRESALAVLDRLAAAPLHEPAAPDPDFETMDVERQAEMGNRDKNAAPPAQSTEPDERARILGCVLGGIETARDAATGHLYNREIAELVTDRILAVRAAAPEGDAHTGWARPALGGYSPDAAPILPTPPRGGTAQSPAGEREQDASWLLTVTRQMVMGPADRERVDQIVATLRASGETAEERERIATEELREAIASAERNRDGAVLISFSSARTLALRASAPSYEEDPRERGIARGLMAPMTVNTFSVALHAEAEDV